MTTATVPHLKPSARRVLAQLRKRPSTTRMLMQPGVGGVRFGARVGELREAGFVIREQYRRKGSHLYTLVVDVERGEVA